MALLDEQDDSLIGGAILGDLSEVHDNVVILEYFFVNPEKRGKGIGSNWFLKLLEHLRQNTRYTFMVLECVKGLIGFYSRLGAFDTHIKPSLCVRSLSSPSTTLSLSSKVCPPSLLSLMAVSLHEDGSEEFHDSEFLNSTVNYLRNHLHRMISMKSKTIVLEDQEAVCSFNVWYQSE